MDISAHSATRMRAEACHGGSVHWVEITITETSHRGQTESSLTVFLDTARKADAYANAINAADAEFHPLPKLPIGASA